MFTLAKMQRVLGIKFEISEKISYAEKTKEIRTPYSDGTEMWLWKPFKNAEPNYDVYINLPKPEPEKKIA
jgi:hypothetical protein